MFRPADDPIREGTRGGHDRFDWKDVKDDRQKERYLGNSIKVPYSKYNYGKDFFWYEKNSDIHVNKEDIVKKQSEEIENVKRLEQQLMEQALGIQRKEEPLEKEDEHERKRSKSRKKERQDERDGYERSEKREKRKRREDSRDGGREKRSERRERRDDERRGMSERKEVERKERS